MGVRLLDSPLFGAMATAAQRPHNFHFNVAKARGHGLRHYEFNTQELATKIQSPLDLRWLRAKHGKYTRGAQYMVFTTSR